MKRYTTTFACGITVLFATSFVAASDDKKPAPRKAGVEPVIIDFGSLNMIRVSAARSQTNAQIRLSLWAKDGSTSQLGAGFTIRPSVLIAGDCSFFSMVLKAKDWELKQDGGILTVFGHIDKEGRLSPLTKIRMSALGSFPVDFFPRCPPRVKWKCSATCLSLM